MINFIENYKEKILNGINLFPLDKIDRLYNDILKVWENKNNLFLFGNGGSAGNANHLANDFTYGVSQKKGFGLSVESLCSNPSVLTCLANDIGYENIFSFQINNKVKKGDLIIALSGSGNSRNIIKAINAANKLNITNYAILGFDGGECKNICPNPIHIPIHDMQVSEDLQMIIGHICIQWLKSK